MSAVSTLNVSIGLDLKRLEKELKNAEKLLQKGVAKIGDAADKLSMRISAPFALISVGALKAAGDIEALKLGMQSTMRDVGRTVEEANIELKALFDTAKKPGIDFEQAIRGSIRLQNVGYSAEKARHILEQLANTIAMTGGTAHELDSVTRQFGQMIAKGRILQEELTIIQENMPGISKAMDMAFGTRSAERLREMGITAEQFVAGVVKQMEGFDRVEGGLQNSIVNFFLSMRVAAAQFGESLDKAFGVRFLLENFSKTVMDLAAGFDALSGSTKSVILGVGVFAVALGPALKLAQGGVYVFGQLYMAVQSLRSVFMLSGAPIQLLNERLVALRLASLNAQKTVMSAEAYSSAKAAIEGAAGATSKWSAMMQILQARWAALNLMTKATVIGAVIAVVAALAVAFGSLNREVSETERKMIAVADISKKASEATASERYETEQLVNVLKAQNSTNDEKEKALKRLQEINWKYYGTLKLENGAVNGLNDAYQKHITNVLNLAKAKAASERISELEKEKMSLRSADLGAMDMLGMGLKTIASRGTSGSIHDQDMAARAKKVAAIEKEQKMLADLQLQYEWADEAVGKFSDTQKDGSRASEETTKNLKKQSAALKDALADVKQFEESAKVDGLKDEEYASAKILVLRESIKKLIEAGFTASSKQVTNLKTEITELEKKYGIVLKTNDALESLKGYELGGAMPQSPKLPQAPAQNADQAAYELNQMRAAQSMFEGGGITASADQMVDDLNRLRGAQEAYENSVESGFELLPLLDYMDEFSAKEQAMQGIFDRMAAGTMKVGAAIKELSSILEENGTAMEQIMVGVAASVTNYAEQGGASLKEFASVAVSSMLKVVRAQIMQGVSAAVANALTNIPFPFNIAAGSVAGAAAGTLFNGLMQKIGVPKFAKGGVVHGPTLAMVGDNPNARHDPEIISPLSKLKKMIGDGGGGDMVLSTRIAGDDLLVLMERVEKKRGRSRGF